jgi:bifunctional non-homologous end joining protein LigD
VAKKPKPDEPAAPPLEEYRRKRHFARTPEPAGDQSQPGATVSLPASASRATPPVSEHAADQPSPGPRLLYVIHKHDASRLHYDLRLELDGVLKSWAVPKGPCLDPSQKRLAVHVEDHPIEYGQFEGTIPEGEYGAGTVMLWDRGSWEPSGDAAASFAAGAIRFRLLGRKLQGDWKLVRFRGRTDEGDNWLLIKSKDEHTRPLAEFDILKASPDSVATGRSMEQIARGEPM